MKFQNTKYLYISTLLAFILIPLGGLTTDIYIPSLPAMAEDLNVPVEKVQISLLLFMVSSGFSSFLSEVSLTVLEGTESIFLH
ncbi:hypothetical protein [Chryseobacterium arachidis]|nr:hypothetical protein [Chryseobacterium arachidis]